MSSRDKILARRAKFIAAAIASIGVAGCSSRDAPTSTDAGATDASVDTINASDTGPVPCLEPQQDTGQEDTGPMPCLDPLPDTGADDASDTEPMPCLQPPIDGG
jgi:hypothetical protein